MPSARGAAVCHLGASASALELDARHLSSSFWDRVVLSAIASSTHPHQQSQTSLAAVVYGRGVGVAQCLGVAARRSHGAAPTWGSTTAAARSEEHTSELQSRGH